jgi:hypothetical protein
MKIVENTIENQKYSMWMFGNVFYQITRDNEDKIMKMDLCFPEYYEAQYDGKGGIWRQINDYEYNKK